MSDFALERGVNLAGRSNREIAETEVNGSVLYRRSSDFETGIGRLRITKWTLGFNTNYKVYRRPTPYQTLYQSDSIPLNMLTGAAIGQEIADDLVKSIEESLSELWEEGTLFKDRNNRVTKVRVDSIGGEVGQKQFRPHAHANVSVHWYTTIVGTEKRLEMNYVVLRSRVLKILREKYKHPEITSLAFFHSTNSDDEMRLLAYTQKQVIQTRMGWDENFLNSLQTLREPK